MKLQISQLVLALAACQLADARGIVRRGQLNMIPKYPYDPDTIKTCVWWLDSDATTAWTCSDIMDTFGLSMTDFQRWNPTLPSPCGALPQDQSFCIAATDARPAIETLTVPVTSSETITVSVGTLTVPRPTTIPVTVPFVVSTVQTVTATVTTTVQSVQTPLVGDNGVATPVPYQPGMVKNCKTFYLVQEGDTCVKIAAKFQVAENQIVAWNPEANNDCTRLLANNYCCVGVL
ncbi:hypothetical protein QBC47DRAFT_151259 [Echria macrotheca]|uniref:LysM domain-containing protein n=1 Tax=Echria macrotheca TaxID=438768 RepID=A0AAJ0F109_9PEZI|nr:hypothetical protein QBC47DRAFT_151259 [Echria macrotheca]